MILFYCVFGITIFAVVELLIYNEIRLLIRRLTALVDILEDLKQDLQCANCTRLCFNADEKREKIREINDNWKKYYDEFSSKNKKYCVLKFLLYFIFIGFRMPKFEIKF